AAGIDAVGGLARAVRADPAAVAAIAEAGAGLARAVAAGAEPDLARQPRFAAAAGEHLDHAADGFRAVQARARPAYDLDALDLRHRQILERRHAGGRRVDLDPVHQQQHVVGFGAAQEQAAQLAAAAGIAHVEAGAAAQQFDQVARLAALDLVAF